MIGFLREHTVRFGCVSFQAQRSKREEREEREGEGERGMAVAVVLAALLVLLAPSVCGWRRWSSEVGPEARRGHSLTMYQNKVVLFGGKGKDQVSVLFAGLILVKVGVDAYERWLSFLE